VTELCADWHGSVAVMAGVGQGVSNLAASLLPSAAFNWAESMKCGSITLTETASLGKEGGFRKEAL
jgi:hypothetical protein